MDILGWVIASIVVGFILFAVAGAFYEMLIGEPKEDQFTKQVSQFVVKYYEDIEAIKLIEKIRRYQLDVDTARNITAGEALLMAIPTSRWREFEILTSELLASLGWESNVTKATGDQGLDFIGTKIGGQIAVGQAKHQTSAVGQPMIQNAVGAAVGEKANLVVIASSSGFTRQATAWVSRVDAGIKIELWNRKKIIELINTHEGVRFDSLVKKVVSSPTQRKISNILEVRNTITSTEREVRDAVTEAYGRLPKCWSHNVEMMPRIEGQYNTDIKWLCTTEFCRRGRNSEGEHFTLSRNTKRVF